LDQVLINILNGLSSGLLLFMLSSGLTLIFSMMGVLNFAHASFYMVGAYVAYTLTGVVGFWVALVLAPLLVGALGAVRALLLAPGAQVRPCARTADHLRP
jgi:branched-chain amino acid transport system permease protein